MTDANKKMLLKSLLFVTVLVACLLGIAFSPLRAWLSPENIAVFKSQFNGNVVWFTALFTLAGAMLIAVGFPRTLFCVAAGLLYNLWLAVLIGQIAALAGAYLVYCLSGAMLRPYFQAKTASYLAIINKFRHGNQAIFVALLRQAPIPGIISNALCGAMNINAKNFLLGSFLGFLPQSVIFCLFGSSVNNDLALRIAIACALFLGLVLGLKIYVGRKMTLNYALGIYGGPAPKPPAGGYDPLHPRSFD